MFGQSKKAPKEIVDTAIVDIDGTGEFKIDNVGELHYQDSLNKITGGKIHKGHNIEIEALLLHDDDNPYDNKAIAVTIAGELVGHLDRDIARQYRKQMKAGGFEGNPGACRALIVGGWHRGNDDEGHYGVRFDI
jgi:hypothetical protein